MLEVKGLRKEYKPKKGELVKALDGVDLAFPDKGMIFILGKSGSGKSTMLNLLGGLDTYDSGEIIIKGKSSKDFSQSEFDSYRNTYLGFIFQSYNVLDEFSVGDNIALAIELQNEKATKQRIEDILKQVDLEGFAARKPRELSGGQKQRVAIARALVKNPEIILADEPTGALDSTTGIAVFDTLKSLSKEKLVIIVSHDREFAENYGDRVIEFKDGNIISDIVKYPVENVQVNKNIALYENQAIQIKKGYQLTTADLEEINKQIAKSNEDVYISLNKRTSSATKTAARINDENASEAFRDTKKEDIIVNKNDTFRLKKSRLGLKNSVRIGASGLKVKPGRLIITMILAICAFTLFGVADTMGSYNGANVTYNSFVDSNVTYSGIQKYQITDSGWEKEIDTTDSDIKYFEDTFGVETIVVHEENFFLSNCLENTPSSYYYINNFYHGVCLTDELVNKLGFTLNGELPTNENEIVLPYYMYEHFEVGGYSNYVNGEYLTIDIEEENDLIGLFVNGYKVVGILDTNFDSSAYESLKELDASWLSAYMFQNSMQSELHSMVVYHEDKFVEEEEVIESLQNGFHATINKTDVSVENIFGNTLYKSSNFSTNYFNSSKTSLSGNEVVISYQIFYGLYDQKINEVSYETRTECVADYVAKNSYKASWLTDGWSYSGYEEEYWTDTMTVSQKEEAWVWYLLNFGMESNSYDKTYASGLEICMDLFIEASGVTNSLAGTIFLNDVSKEETAISIVGVSTELNYSEFIISNSLYSEFESSIPESGYAQIIVLFPEDLTVLRQLVDYVYEKDTYTFDFTCGVQTTISMANNYIEDFTFVFLYIGIFFAAFSSLLLFNFISVSISYKQKEIGILRAIGARSKDVFGIFFSETLIIGFINFVVACVGVFIACTFVNTYLREDVGVAMSLLNPSIRQIVLIFGVSLLVSFVSSFFPVYKIAIKRPIESIRQG